MTTQMTTSQARVVDPILSTVAQGYQNSELIGNALFPHVAVQQRAGKILSFGKESFMAYDTARAPGGPIKRIIPAPRMRWSITRWLPPCRSN